MQDSNNVWDRTGWGSPGQHAAVDAVLNIDKCDRFYRDRFSWDWTVKKPGGTTFILGTVHVESLPYFNAFFDGTNIFTLPTPLSKNTSY